MSARFEFRLYSRPFRQPLHTHHGLWRQREGILLRVTDAADRVGYGEIAPIPWFGSETIEQAIEFCRSLPADIEAIAPIADALPACQFGFEAAWDDLNSQRFRDRRSRKVSEPVLPHCGLLPAGAAALRAWPTLWTRGYQTLKWKIAVAPIATEFDILTRLLAALPKLAKLRLDANGGLNFEAARQWLSFCKRYSQIELLEQPLPPDQFDRMLRLSGQFPTAIALDESVATLPQLQDCYARGWRGIFVVKAAIAGSPSRLRDLIESRQLDVVWSSALETPIARRYIETHLVKPPVRALGMGVSHWFADEFEALGAEQLWRMI